MTDRELLTLDVRTLSRLVRERELSVTEVLEAYIASVEANDERINAYITKTFSVAREQARRLEGRIAEGDIPALCGVPFAVKDNIAVEGVPMTCASELLRDFVPPYSATVYERSVDVGGVLLGKTNLDEFAMGSSCENSIFGATKNPHDETRSAGGSSGGSAAAVAAMEAAWAIGSDTGGSARQPAAFCGVCAMKPTYGAVSRYGLTEFASSLDTVCPITKNVGDNALVLEALVGRDRRDMTSLDIVGDYTSGLESGVSGLRIALPRGWDDSVGLETEVAERVKRSAEALRRLGADIVTVSMPYLREAVDVYMTVSAAEASSDLARFDGIRYGVRADADGEDVYDNMKRTRSDGFGREVKRRILTGIYVLSSVLTGDYYRRIRAAGADICKRVDELFEAIDVLLMPTAPTVAFELGRYASSPTDMYSADRFTVLANLTGCPALSVPAVGGRDRSLPVGVMLMGKKLSEAMLYRVAFALEEERRSFERGLCDERL